MNPTTPQRPEPRPRRIDERRSLREQTQHRSGHAMPSRRAGRRTPEASATIDPRLVTGVIGVIVVVLLATALGMRTPEPALISAGSATEAPLTAVAATIEEELGDPTPILAAHGSLQVRSPIPPASITEVGFHQAARNNALPMTTTLSDASANEARGKRGTGSSISAQTAPDDVSLQGSVLRMWRSNRPGKPDTAVDIGAAPGTIVLAPVSGEVTQVKQYWLYGEHEDFEIHIKPDGWDDIEVVIIHVSDVTVSTGDRVVGGVTQIATVRLLSNRVNHQLSEYTADGGDHVHVQLNRLEPERAPTQEGS